MLAKDLFGLEPVVTAAARVTRRSTLQSVRLARWWQAAGFAKILPGADHIGKGWTPRVPSAILETNDPAVYAAFLRGLFEADGTVLDGRAQRVDRVASPSPAEVRTLLLALGLATTTRRRQAAGAAPSSRCGCATSTTR